EVEEYYKHVSGAHRALAFPDFLGLLVGLGLEAYRKRYGRETGPRQEESPGVSGQEKDMRGFDKEDW
ncbi:MAG: hypothetical protein LBJ24_01640, partial [Treponema sp.]|nr:hypothetical protein [Treponema sp.]